MFQPVNSTLNHLNTLVKNKGQDSAVGKQQGLTRDALLKRVMPQAEQAFNVQQSNLLARGAAVEAHEAAHQNAAGHLGGGVHLNYETVIMTMPDGSSRAVSYANSGFVPIAMPGIPPGPPKNESQKARYEKIRSDFQIAQHAALAPAGNTLAPLSGADLSIAAKASQNMSVMDSLIANFNPQATKSDKGNGQKGLFAAVFSPFDAADESGRIA